MVTFYENIFLLLFCCNIAIATDCPSNYFENKEPVVIVDNVELCLDGFSIIYSVNEKTPILSAIKLTKEGVIRSRDIQRKGNFKQEQKLPEYSRVRVEDYFKSGYDKGHLTPFKDIGYSKDINNLSNVVPQSPNLNRGVWAQLEDRIRDDVVLIGVSHIITGVVFTNNMRFIGEQERLMKSAMEFQ